MTTEKDSALSEGTEEKPTSESSNKGTGQRNSEAETVTAEQFRALQKQLETVQRTLQSSKDRAVKQTNERIDQLEGDLRQVLKSAQSKGQTVDELLHQIDEQEQIETQSLLRELALSLKKGGLPLKSSAGTQDESGVDISGILAELELPEDDIRVKEFKTRSFSTEAEAYRESAKLLKSLSKQPSDADRSSEETRRKTYATQQERLMDEYKEGSKNLRGNALIQYKSAMRKKGLDIN